VSIVLANAMGLGPTAPNKYPCSTAVESSEGVMAMVFDIEYKGT